MVPLVGHLFGDTMAESSRKERKESNIQYMKDRDAEKVKGIFRFHERPGGTLDFQYRCYKVPIESYHLNDGEIYELPLGVARHLNVSGRYPVHAHKVDENGKPSMIIGKKVARYGFQSLEFCDIKDMGSPNDLIPEVTKAE